MLPDIESLRCFCAVADVLNFRAAARQVGLSPAALGQRIRLLEEQLDVKLFERTTRRVTLTEAGLALLPAATHTLESAAQAVRAARGDLGPAPMEVTIGTRHELGLSWLVPLLPKLEAAHPGLTCHVYFGSGADLEDRIRTRQVHCAVSSKRFSDPRLDAEQLQREDYVFVAAPALLAERPFESIEDAAHHTLVDTDPDLPLFGYLRQGAGRTDNIGFERLLFMGTIDAIRAVVKRGDGVAVLPRYLIPQELASGALVPLLPEVTIQHDWFRLVFWANDPLRAVYGSMAEILREEPLR